ncbi:type VI secretion system tube protein TssD [uncultured Bacteroides sp.]|uniref:type VI secretion system tube protein TssD n=1 Tax=uncultured Bacteroides sp. TaxID=162156 RepID=UPI0026172FD5|nr:type VI secretion system tube protein TssD [uncultured Bacteroides sp.]
MAKTPVKLEVDGYKEREVMMVKYEFDQATDVEGQMSGIPRGGKINIRVKAHNSGTPDLLAWMVERNLPKNGVITFLETKTGKVMKTIKFTNGYCVNFEEKWEDKQGHFEEIEITCQKIEFESVVFENDWA